MTQNKYSLPELIDLALRINEDGVVNFSILRTILQSIVIELKLTDVRPPCDIESNLISKVALQNLKKTQTKLKEIEAKTRGRLGAGRVPCISRAVHLTEGTTEDEAHIEQDETEFSSLPSETAREEKSPEEKVLLAPEPKHPAIQTEETEPTPTEVTQTPVKNISESKDDDEESGKMKLEKKSLESLPYPPGKPSTTESEKTKSIESKDFEVTETLFKDISESKGSYSETQKMELEKKSIESLPDSPENPSPTESETTKEVESKDFEVTETSVKEISESKDADSGTGKMEVDEESSIPTEKKSIESVPDPVETATESKTAEDIGEIEEIKEILTATKELLGQEDTVFGKQKPENFLADTSEKSSISSKKTMDHSITQTSVTSAEPEKKTQKTMLGQGTEGAQSQWKYTDMNQRVRATEEGLYTISNIVDRIAEQMARSAKRREGGPSTEELEDFDDRIFALEDLSDQFSDDHKMLMDMNEKLLSLLKEFEAFKALEELLEKMRIDISQKADKEETWAALEMKADAELVNSKVDRWEFEIAVEELGEAIGLLGVKFRRKNDEWEERAAEIWKAIDSKMTFDVFEAARIKIESRLTALMYGLRKLKKVIEDLLYPEASGVTRCILCRRPACISGLECLEGFRTGDSPKRPLSAGSSGDSEDAQNLRKILDDAIAKRQKLEVPPYSEISYTIIRIPYRSSSYGSSRDDEKFTDTTQMKLQPVATDREFANSKKSSQIPKLPTIDKSKSKTSMKDSSLARSKITSHAQKSDLYFTKKMLSKAGRKRSSPKDAKYRFTAILEVESSKSPASTTSSKSSVSTVDLTSDPAKTMKAFAPARAISDVMRRGVLLSPKSPTEEKSNMSLSPL